ncbi:winged helix-turn-helix domain-containing protein [Sinorhizobium sp. 8-89]|uniref:winged helix-turn-helix domain-containing protein n=1 Tax=Sinorhizobium sp. 7-81 TaxID=3049087 RepID=UPI0024C23AD9|nr:winged helix-turn-helix domain-containing protein [Sinorhizobium sp. 7-81]MDK1389830.1 winged helix-turn-helix domain-containing protein [Sinorhizobium sp. 7-81]
MLNESTSPESLPPPIVLIAAADDSFRSFLEYTVRRKELVVAGVSDGKGLAERLQGFTPDVLLLESLLPGIETQTLCARLRLDRRTRLMSIIVLAAEGDQVSEQEFLESGADQYLSRPFSPETLMTSIGAMWRDSNRIPVLPRELLTFLDLELDVTRHRVRRNGRIIHLGPTEFRLLHQLMKNPHRVYSREELQNAAWPRAVHVGPRTVDVHIGRLRAVLNEAGGQNLIRTVRSVGYALSE